MEGGGYGNFGTQGVSVTAKHFFGVNTSVKDSIYLVNDDNTLIYVAGHNIIFYRLDEKEQTFHAGSNDTEAITHVALSKSKQYLAICERCTAGNKGKFTIYNMLKAGDKNKIKALPEQIQDMNAFDSQEFVASAFSPKEERMIVTLTGSPDWQVFLWNWEREKLIAKTSIGIQGEIERDICSFQLSYNPFDQSASTILVTGPNNTYVYMKQRKEENDIFFTHDHSQINNLE